MAHYLHMTDPVDINAEFGRFPNTPLSKDKSSQATWSSPRRKRGWVWGGSKHDRDSLGPDAEEYKENSRPSTLSRRKSIKNMFSTVRNGLLQHNQAAGGDIVDCGSFPVGHQKESRPSPSAERAADVVDKLPRPRDLRRSKSLSFLGSLGQTISARRGSKQTGMLRVYPGIDQLSRNGGAWDEERPSSKNDNPDPMEPPKYGDGTIVAEINHLEEPKNTHFGAKTEQEQAERKLQTAGRVHFQEPAKESESQCGPIYCHDQVVEKLESDKSETTIPGPAPSLYSTKDHGFFLRGNTPDSYLRQLIEDSIYPTSDSETSSPSSSASLLNEGRMDFLTPTTVEEMKSQRIEEREVTSSLLHSLGENNIPLPQPQYSPDGFEVSTYQDHMDQRTIVTVREVSAFSDTPLADFDDACKSATYGGYEEYVYQSDGQTTLERVKTRIQRTLAVMTKNLYLAEDSDGDSDFEKDFTLGFKTKAKDDSEVSELSSVSASGVSEARAMSFSRSSWAAVVRDGRKEQSSPSFSEHDSGVSWFGEDMEGFEEHEAIGSPIKLSRRQNQNQKHSHSISSSKDVNHFTQQPCFGDEKKLQSSTPALERKELLSGWGRSRFSDPPDTAFGPVQVNFPETSTSAGHTELYDTRSEAITAIFHENIGDFDGLCTFDPTIRVIFVHLLDKFVPDYDEINKLGLEILSIPTNYSFNDINYPRPLFFPQDKCTSVHDITKNSPSADELAGMLSETSLATDKGKAVEIVEGQEIIHDQIDRRTVMVSPSFPTSSVSVTLDVAERENEGTIFEDDFFLEIDLSSQRSNSSCDIWQATSEQDDGSERVESVSLNEHDDTHEVLQNHMWNAKTWPELGREYISSIDSPTSKISVNRYHTSGSESLGDREIEVERSPNPQTAYKKEDRDVSPNRKAFFNSFRRRQKASPHRKVIFDSSRKQHGKGSPNGDFKLELRKISNPPWNEDKGISSKSQEPSSCIENREFDPHENSTDRLQTALDRTCQQAIDEIVAIKNNTLERSIGLLEKNFLVTVESYTPEESIVQLDENWAPDVDKPCVKDIVDEFEDLNARARLEKQEMRSFSYPLQYSPAESRVDLTVDHHYHGDFDRFHNWKQRCVSNDSDATNASGFRFTDYIQELAEIASNGTESASNVSYVDKIASVESCRTPIYADGLPRPITAEDLNVRLVGKATYESKLAKQKAKGGALVGLFQSHGLMPQSQPTLRGPTALGSSPFKNITNSSPSLKSSPIEARSGDANVDTDAEKGAKGSPFKRTHSELSVNSIHESDTLDFADAYQMLEKMRLSW